MSSPQPPGPPPRPSRERGRVTRIHVAIPHAGILPTESGHFEATEFAERRSGLRGAWLSTRDRLVGRTLASRHLETERLTKVKALAVFSSDAISSTAYATQEILFILILAGAGALTYSLPIAIAILVLLAIVITSYRQTVRAYPNGGGSFIVAHENLGIVFGLIAAAALMIDYVLTVAVSVAASMDALASLDHAFRDVAVELAILVVVVVALINLRGVRESGTIFAVPTYAFILLLGGAVGTGFVRVLLDGENPLSVGEPQEPLIATQAIGILFISKAFANGCTALTGVEAISDGVAAFQRPTHKNAAQTLLAMGLILGSLFLGITILARHHGFIPDENHTIPSQLGAEAFGDGSALFLGLQIMTAGILMLAANTAFADFPRLAAILGREGYVPRIFSARGNRLVFSYGIVALASLAILLLVAFNATTTRLIPLYALGVFISFTLSQAGMVVRWRKNRGSGWRTAMVVNAAGSITTFFVLLIILNAKFMEGAWVVVLLIPILASIAALIGRYYRSLARALNVPVGAVLDLRPHGTSPVPAIVPVEAVNLATLMALAAACERSRDVRAVHVVVDPDTPSTVEEQWRGQFANIPLVVIDSPFRTVSEPIAVYVNDVIHEPPHEATVLVPTIETRRWYERLLVNQSLRRLTRLLEGQRRRVTIVPVPFAPGGRGRRGAPWRR